jgi:hypothetical protein
MKNQNQQMFPNKASPSRNLGTNPKELHTPKSIPKNQKEIVGIGRKN